MQVPIYYGRLLGKLGEKNSLLQVLDKLMFSDRKSLNLEIESLDLQQGKTGKAIGINKQLINPHSLR